MCQPSPPYTHGTLPPNHLETRVAMIPVDQTVKACRLNVGQNLGDVQFMSIVTNQPFADCKRAIECQLIYLVFRIASKPSSARG